MMEPQNIFRPKVTYLSSSRASHKSFRILQLNSQSLRHKIDLLEAEIIKYDMPEIIVVTETWIEPATEHHYNIEGYVSYHLTRPDAYGGVSIFVRNTINHESPKNIHNENGIQILELNIKNPELSIVAVYRSPSSSIPLFLPIIDRLLEREMKVILCGDINIDLLSPNSSETIAYTDTIEANSYFVLNNQHPDAATYRRITGNTNSLSILDHFITNIYNKNFNIQVQPSIGDHECVILDITEPGGPSMENQEMNKVVNYNKIKRELTQYLMKKNSRSIEELHQQISSIITKFTDIKPASKKPNLPWIDSQVLREIDKRNKFYRNSHRNNLTDEQQTRLKSKYKAQKNKVTALIRWKKKIYVTKRIGEGLNNSRKLWQIMRGVFKNQLNSNRKTNPLPDSLKIAQTTITDKDAKLNALNQHFINVGTVVRYTLNMSNGNRPRTIYPTWNEDKTIFLYPTTKMEITKIITALRSDAAAGYDNISPKTLKEVKELLAEAISPLINQCLEEGRFPTTFKQTIVIPIYKGSGEKHDCNNYRPISLISNLSKIMEKLIYDRLTGFLTSTRFFASNQYGFLPGSNTTTAILHAIDKIKSGLDDAKHVAALFFDISKAFDCVDHALLLSKLENAGIRGKANDIIQDYLFARRQKVMAEEKSSQEAFILNGIPQGSSLSSLLFLIYTNDLHKIGLEGNYQTFADDTAGIYVYNNRQTLYEKMQRDINKISDWFYSNHLAVNANKTKVMVFKMKNKAEFTTPNLTLNHTVIEQVSVYKYLGFKIDDRLSFTDHVMYVKSKIMPFLSVIKRTRYLVPENTLRSLYYAYVHSHLVHLISVWGFTSETMLDRLQIIQNKAIRFVFWREYYQQGLSTDYLYKKHNILKVRKLVRYDTLFTIYKMKHGLIKSNVTFTTFSQLHNYSTRGRNDLVLPGSRTTMAYKSLFREGLSWYNTLPTHLKSETRTYQFKKRLKQFLAQ